jgi:hypothetical protein
MIAMTGNRRFPWCAAADLVSRAPAIFSLGLQETGLTAF